MSGGSQARGPQAVVTSLPGQQSPTEFGTRVTRHPHYRASPLPSSFPWRSSNEEHVCVLHPQVRRPQAEESAPCKDFPLLGTLCQGSPTPLAIWPEGPKGDTRRPRAGQPSPTRSDLTVQPQVPSVCACACACACACVCKRVPVGWGHSEQKQADEGPMSNRQVMFTPQVKPGCVGRGVRGLHPSAQVLSRALQGWVTAFQVQGCAHTGLCLIWEQQGDWVGG